ncbi:sphingomyelin phosphodiesterase [Ixodes scapularis]|uniref:sphingomyelin phosphodiesterase n=1 Tax=Ixodes scapularis TaxID=6945 RepID=UPI001A9CFDF8|nr:sphingomyelin phosphodiesterase [Ixodes scapularis]XP_029846363.2 sphingomyelin phosphodiesterase [Ixodes scapularis]XP_029846364.2 sphingomyelin phosphodiesterase [Ixodes scapularis]
MRVSVFLLALCLPAVLLLPARHPRGPNVHREFWRQKLHVIATFFRRLGSEATMIAATNHFLPYCGACKLATSVVQQYIKQDKSEEEMVSFLRTACKMFSITTPRVCDGIISHFKEEFFFVLKHTKMDSTQICGTVFPDECEGHAAVNWTVPLPPQRTPRPDPVPAPSSGAPTLRVLHLSDTHVDMGYEEGSLANCEEPLCCHANDGRPKGPEHVAAGHWGYFKNCDIPPRTFESMLKHIRDSQKIDFVIWTGDIVAHDIWNTSRASNLAVIDYTTKTLAKYLDPSGVPVFPALGNHEGEPVDSFPLPEVKGNMSISWLYDALVEQWSHWLPESTAITLKRGGFYATKAFPGLKIVSLNMNYCNSLNWWLLLNSTDPADELLWLVEQLQESEIQGEKVHIIGHIPPGIGDCLQVWSENYHRIISRFEDTVRGQFFGHTHMDELELFYDPTDPKRAMGVAYLAPSVTTFNSGHPAFRVYTIDGNYPNSTWMVLDHETYIMNLTEANASPEAQPVWKAEYSAKSAYGMASLQPQEWDRTLRKMQDDDVLFDRFYRYYSKQNPLEEPCNTACRTKVLCEQRTARSSDLRFC